MQEECKHLTFMTVSELIKTLSPYMTKHIKRFGKYSVNMDEMPEPLLLSQRLFDNQNN